MVPSAHAAQPATSEKGANAPPRAPLPAPKRAEPSAAAYNPAQSQSPAQQQDYLKKPLVAGKSSPDMPSNPDITQWADQLDGLLQRAAAVRASEDPAQIVAVQKELSKFKQDSPDQYCLVN